MPSLKQSEAERKQAEEKLRHQLDFTRAITNSLGEGVYALDAEGRLTFMNPAAEQMLGWKEAEMLGQNAHDCIHFQRADRTPVPAEECSLLSVMRSNRTITDTDDVFTRRDGSLFPVSYTSSPIVTDGRVVGAVLAFRDITRRQQAERRLATQHAATRILAEAATIDEAASKILEAVCEGLQWTLGALWKVEADAGLIRCIETWHSPSVEVSEFESLSEQTTFKADEGLPGRVWASGKPAWITDITANGNFPRARIATREGLHGAFGFPILLGSEVLGVMEFFSRELREPDEDLLRMIAAIGSQIGQFIERMRAETALRESEERYRIVAETASDAIITINEQSRILFLNRAAEKIFGYSMAEMQGAELTMLMPEYLRRLHNAGLGRYVETGQRHISWEGVELPGLHKDGHEVPLEVSFGEFSKNGLRIFTGIVRDITERKRAGEALRKSEEQYRFLAEAIPQQVWTAKPDGALDFVNQRVLDYFGRTMEEVIGRGWQDGVHPEDLRGCLDRWRNSLETGETYAVEFRLRRASDETYRWHLGRALPVRDHEGQIVKWFGTNTDIEEQKLMEEALALMNRRREQMLEEVSTPVVPVWRGVLAMPIIGTLDTERMQRATEAALGEVVRTGAHACIIDITAARLVDSHAVANLGHLVASLKLLGTEAIVTGVTAQAARSLVSLGIDFAGMRTRRTLAGALATLIKSSKQNSRDRFLNNGNSK